MNTSAVDRTLRIGISKKLTKFLMTARTSTQTNAEPQPLGSNDFPPPKTDKPRPHVCGTCGRSFARLEHLKRHERSHTKEKPFECPECTRCFARRDLLLRHQQKLHMTTTPSSKPRGGRRESAAGLGPNGSGKVRKNSVASINGSTGAGNHSMRPRANTISHIDAPTLGLLAGTNGNISTTGSMPHPTLGVGSGGFGGRPIASAPSNHHRPPVLPRLATNGLNINMGGGDLRTAPPGPNMGNFNFDDFNGAGPTINPAQLHLNDSLQPSPHSPFIGQFPTFQSHPPPPIMEDEHNLDWVQGFSTQMNFNNSPDPNLRHSPSSLGGASPGGMHEPQFDANGPSARPGGHNWHMGLMPPQMHGAPSFSMDGPINGTSVGDFMMPTDTISPENLQAHTNGADHMFTSPLSINSFSPSSVMSNGFGHFHPQMPFGSDETSMSSQSGNGSARNSSTATSVSTDSITDVTRQALLISLSQPSVFGRGQRKYSQPAVSSPLSPRDQVKQAVNGPSLPSTQDLQRFVSAYIQYFHPHFPFLHVPTLFFDTPAYTSDLKAANGAAGYAQGGILGGGGCLILAMAAIGALYEYDRDASRELFEAAKKMIQLYLEERRKADAANAANGSNPAGDLAAQNTPLWLVQAMLLNVVYGHNCGDKTAGDIASTHCTALISLARAAELVRPMTEVQLGDRMHSATRDPSNGDVHMSDDYENDGMFRQGMSNGDEANQWHKWIVTEERKRTLFAIFHMSSLLVSAYNHAPALMNSEIQLDLPCDEELWTAPNARLWGAKGGSVFADHQALHFSTALGSLLSASQFQNQQQTMSPDRPFGSGIPLAQVPQSHIKPSTFGCLVLIDALHNYIWETRQRHSGRRWTTQETESMQAHIEPALRAWQAAWATNPTHSLERPNPYGLGPLSADSIPLLDLAYVRLFVNLGTSKEAFWQRDFDAMSEELARGTEIVQHADHSDASTGAPDSANGSRNSPEPASADIKLSMTPTDDTTPMPMPQQKPSNKRERHLRKAAFYAADSLSMSDKLGVTFAHFNSRELPVQSAMCAFDCAQVLAEWTATVQERVGRYLGILGRDNIDYTQMPAIIMLEDEDCKLLDKISDILQNADEKMRYEINGMGLPPDMHARVMQTLPSAIQEGFGSKILRITGFMLDRAAVWPVTTIMSQGLQIQANHMCTRADASVNLGQ
ncbi:MAG: hypothetical protein M1828_007615 [Chrysothrix sp. TS-e1954]|nr:MAG: hypothetical protein M1828_007615 [Chrysothrix sp. TS-e1954]